MSFEFLGIKSTTIIPALGGALVYAIRAAEKSTWARVTGGVAGFLTATFAGPPATVAAETYLNMGGLTGGVTFTIGVAGAGLVEALLGFIKDPKGTIAAFKLTRK